MKTNAFTLAAAAALLVPASFVASASADTPSEGSHKRDYLKEQPAVRHRLLLVAKRLEATPMFESTINADFRHFIGGGLKLEYHLGDMFSVGGLVVGATALDTKLTKRVVETLEPTVNDMSREPSVEEFTQRLNTLPIHGAAYASLTPWYGKLAAFGKAYVNFDFYFQGGVAFASLKSDCSDAICNDTHPGIDTNPADPMMGNPDDNPNNDPPLNSGFRPGLYLGGGIHVFVNDFVAIDLAVRDYAFKDNPSGADFNADLFVGEEDSRFLHHLFFGVGASVMVPFQVKRTR
jgi:outer membrane beta-barrel protein